jgi:hypothetical protein
MINRLEDDVFNLQARWQNALEKVEKHVFQLGLQMELSRSKQWKHLTFVFAKKSTGFLPLLRSPIGIGVSTMSVLGAAQLALSVGMPPIIAALVGLGGMGLSLLITKIGGDLLWKQQFSKPPESGARQSDIQLLQADPNEIKTMRTFALIVLNALRDAGKIKTTDHDELDEVTVTELKTGYFRFSLNGYTRQENDTFLTALGQLLEPIRQPRYILALAKKPKAHQIIPVPHLLGNNKKNALAFTEQWNKYFPEDKAKTSLHWTASVQGQRYLLKARVAAYGESHNPDQNNLINLIDRWE